MPLRERAYYGLDEIQARLKLTRRELLYLVENGLLKASARVWDAVIEEGEYDRAADGQMFRLPTDQRRFSGLASISSSSGPSTASRCGSMISSSAATSATTSSGRSGRRCRG